MFKVEIAKVKYYGNKIHTVRSDTFYFNHEDAYEEAMRFRDNFNATAEVSSNEYKFAKEPVKCESFDFNQIIIEAFDEVKRQLGNINLKTIRSNAIRHAASMHRLGEHI